jgi:hypothetical protein
MGLNRSLTNDYREHDISNKSIKSEELISKIDDIHKLDDIIS